MAKEVNKNKALKNSKETMSEFWARRISVMDGVSVKEEKSILDKKPKKVVYKNVIENTEILKKSVNTAIYSENNPERINKKITKAASEEVVESENIWKSRIDSISVAVKQVYKIFSQNTIFFLKKSFSLTIIKAIKFKKELILILAGFLLASLLYFISTLTYGYFTEGFNGKNLDTNSQDIPTKVSQSISLPISEIPQVYKIDSENSPILKNPGFSDVKKEDLVLVYAKNKRVIVFRPSENKVVIAINTGVN